MLKGGVIMDVVTPEEARIAEEAGAVAVMALERVPADIRKQGGVARMSDPQEIRAPVELVRQTKALGRLPVVNFAAGGVATPADAALMMQLGMDGVFVGSGIFKSGDPAKRARAIVQAVTHYNDPAILAEVSADLGDPMVGIDIREKGFRSYAERSE
eukprot:scaffold11.g3972.t1